MKPTNDKRLEQLRATIDNTLADPGDDEARITCGRMACTVGLLLLDERDDRRALLLHLLDDAASSSSAASKRRPRQGTAGASGRGRRG